MVVDQCTSAFHQLAREYRGYCEFARTGECVDPD
jgi:hypothetical protein